MDLGKRFEKFNLSVLKTVGKGTYGNVFLCEIRVNNQLTIVKDIELCIKVKNHKLDIANEVKILSAIKHPNVIRFYDCYYTDNHVMISMEYATSGNLAEYMYQRCPKLIKQQEILFFFSQVLLGVNYIHNLDIIHRDLKAENILLTVQKRLVPLLELRTIWHRNYVKENLTIVKAMFGRWDAITSGSVHPIELGTYSRGMQDLIDSMLSILADKRPTIRDLMGRNILLPTIYTVFLDAGNDELLYLKANNEFND
ncbi:NIMA-related kinase 8 [Operophtera brumata]|uniref:non-specific serine/threonine protein kinase n=1 Tax=Operophtera brumata TaxID=104452 RepID=A0A0L7K4C3_OPEBR|nr:NIMA-related kinase 8 [Operophtera brumata]